MVTTRAKSGYITFSDELGDFMQVDTFVSAQINGVPFDEVTKTTKGNTDTYEFSGVAKDPSSPSSALPMRSRAIS